LAELTAALSLGIDLGLLPEEEFAASVVA